jgi:tRNA-specific 2-thiouridylase
VRIAVGLSGGVDSAVAALLLKREGHDVIGLFMKNWEDGEAPGECHASRDFDDVTQIGTHLQIPYYSVNFVKEYRERVFEPFLTDCRRGLTPNPDILCNREIKFNLFLNKAREFGADFLATGHYCRKEGGHLLKGLDPEKDQSYFLYAIDNAALTSALFPIGHLCKSEVRAIAREAGLPVADKKDSTGICFIGERNFKPFLSQFLGFQPGPVLTLDGKEVGTHDGLAYHTIGQRKGLGLGGEGEPWYVVGKDLERNAVLVERGTSHPALYSHSLIAEQLTWIGDAPSLPLSCSAKIRYRQKDTPCDLVLEGTSLHVRFHTPQRAITPGQSVVFYQEDRCLGGGIIHP